ncbi:MAG: carbohydrate binding family 9 domain-containing protein [bacterium]|nr:carbohydrate binding family 9 domain-containing protein [bacterium]
MNVRNLRLTALFICVGLLSSLALTAQSDRRAVKAVRLSTEIRIDGKLTEEIWGKLPLITDFVQFSPRNGKPPSQRTEARVGYDDTGIYVGFICYDDSPHRIRREIAVRDQFPPGMNADAVGIHISPYNDGLHSKFFDVSAAGVQRDMKITGDQFEKAWDSVWQSSVRITDFGWVAEIKIPLSALRFSSQPVQNWGFNLWRWIAENREWAHWSFVDINYPGWWRKPGQLEGIKKLRSRLRLSFTPYVSGYLETESGKGSEFLYNGGIDLKYGITGSFTLDATLIPDFGQIQSDDEELNLTPYEIKFNEKRQFFTEGTELFNKGDIFYSRRIGSRPVDYHKPYEKITGDEEVLKNPRETRLINATKVSGRTDFGLGIGVLNAMTANTHATIFNPAAGEKREVLTQRFTNYNLLVLDQTLFNQSYISLINSNVLRKGYAANVTAVDFRLANKSNTYAVNGIGAYSRIGREGTAKTGYKMLLDGGKIGGAFQARYNLSVISDNYDQNDLGYLRRNNEIVNQLTLTHKISKAFAGFLELNNSLQFMYNRVYEPGAFSEFIINYEFSSLFKNHYKLTLRAELAPVDRNDYYEPRIPGRFFVNHKYYKYGISANTDPRKPFYVEMAGDFRKSYDYDPGVKSIWTTLSPRLRFSDHLNVNWAFTYEADKNQPGYVSHDEVTGGIYFGKRDRQTIINTIEATYLFNNKLSLNCRLRHYWSKADYDSYYELTADGGFAPSGYNTNHNINFNLFNIDLTFRWNFAPGSEIVLNWKNAISTSGEWLINNYWQNFTDTLKEPQVNSFSIKILYYFDI